MLDYGKILDEAHKAAAKAQLGMTEHPLNCGFAWIKIPGNSPMAHFCRKQMKQRQELHDKKQIGPRTLSEAAGHFGSRDEIFGGWRWSYVGLYTGQDMDIKAAGCRAFQDVLARYGIAATVETRLD